MQHILDIAFATIAFGGFGICLFDYTMKRIVRTAATVAEPVEVIEPAPQVEPEVIEELVEEPAIEVEPAAVEEPEAIDYSAQTVVQLRALAKAREISLKGITRKTDIVAAIAAADQ